MKLAKIKERGIRDANQTNGSRFPSALEIKTKDGGRFINENRSFDINSKKNTSQPNLQQKKPIKKFVTGNQKNGGETDHIKGIQVE